LPCRHNMFPGMIHQETEGRRGKEKVWTGEKGVAQGVLLLGSKVPVMV